jgi:hypothetical protein
LSHRRRARARRVPALAGRPAPRAGVLLVAYRCLPFAPLARIRGEPGTTDASAYAQRASPARAMRLFFANEYFT